MFNRSNSLLTNFNRTVTNHHEHLWGCGCYTIPLNICNYSKCFVKFKMNLFLEFYNTMTEIFFIFLYLKSLYVIHFIIK